MSEELINNSNKEIDVLKKKLEDTELRNSTLEGKLKNKNEEISNLKDEIDNLKKNELSKREEETIKLNKKIEELNNLISQKESELQKLQETLSEKDKVIEEQTTHIKEVEDELKQLNPPEMDSISEGDEHRTKCLNCGAVGKNIKIVEDKTKVLSYMGNIPMYAKKHVCKKCGYEF